MNILDDSKIYKKLDTGKVAESIFLLSDQIEDTAKAMEKLKINADFKKINKIVVSGMGGSNLGPRIVASLFKEELRVPLIIEAGYIVPGFVDKNTLYIISSYSGNTEEPLSTYEEAKKKGAKIIAITSSLKPNRLLNLIQKEKIPAFVFEPDKNPAGEPRLGLGYSIFGCLFLFQKIGLLKINKNEVKELLDFLRKKRKGLTREIKMKSNLAKKIASKFAGRHIVSVGAEFLEGNLHTSRNELCECSDNFNSYLVLPDMNHFALDGLNYPKENKKNLIFFFWNSDLYSARTKKRSALTEEAIAKNGLAHFNFKLSGKTRLIQSFEMLQLSMWVAYYLAMLNNENPLNIPWVGWFKKKLG